MVERLGWKVRYRDLAVLLLLGLILVAGCRSTGQESPAAAVSERQMAALSTNTAVPTLTATPQPSHTPTITPSPTPTVTPTATAVPITTTGNPRANAVKAPERLNNAVCGLVDYLDFPLDPPDALNVSFGGQDFGNFRGRYDQYHAGEDWQLVRGRSNLGVPVYAIGHGRVTYAQPLGWGRDQGVIIIEHTFADNSRVLSFYGHMEPESVNLGVGDCVVRGQKIAEIGNPRTPPHLHFEIRTHMPDEPGPGYWPVDPTEAGWLPPSQFVWENRVAANPGVAWTRPFSAESTRDVNLVIGETLITLEGGQLIGLNAADGQVRWQHAITETVANAVLDARRPLLYTADRRGRVTAYPFQELADGPFELLAEPAWQVTLPKVGYPTLLPLPSGGLAVSIWQDVVAIGADGSVLWEEDLGKRPFAWLENGDHLILTLSGRSGPIYSLSAAGLDPWSAEMSGQPAIIGDQIWLYANEGIYQLDPVAKVADLLYQLPPSYLGLGSIVALPEGGALLAHRERSDNRLLTFNPDGTIRWQRSIADLGAGESHLLLHDERPYLLVQSGNNVDSQLKLYAVDIENSTLRHIFTGGTRTPLDGGNWIISLGGDLVLINVGGGSLAALNTDTAVSQINSASN